MVRTAHTQTHWIAKILTVIWLSQVIAWEADGLAATQNACERFYRDELLTVEAEAQVPLDLVAYSRESSLMSRRQAELYFQKFGIQVEFREIPNEPRVITVSPRLGNDGKPVPPAQLKGEHWLTVLATELERRDPGYRFGFSTETVNSAILGRHSPDRRLILIPWGAAEFKKMPSTSIHEWLHFIKDQDTARAEEVIRNARAIEESGGTAQFGPQISRPSRISFYTPSEKARERSRSSLGLSYERGRVSEEGYNRIVQGETALKQARQILDSWKPAQKNSEALIRSAESRIKGAKSLLDEAAKFLEYGIEDLEIVRANLGNTSRSVPRFGAPPTSVITNERVHFYGPDDMIVTWSVAEMQRALKTTASPAENPEMIGRFIDHEIQSHRAQIERVRSQQKLYEEQKRDFEAKAAVHQRVLGEEAARRRSADEARGRDLERDSKNREIQEFRDRVKWALGPEPKDREFRTIATTDTQDFLKNALQGGPIGQTVRVKGASGETVIEGRLLHYDKGNYYNTQAGREESRAEMHIYDPKSGAVRVLSQARDDFPKAVEIRRGAFYLEGTQRVATLDEFKALAQSDQVRTLVRLQLKSSGQSEYLYGTLSQKEISPGRFILQLIDSGGVVHDIDRASREFSDKYSPYVRDIYLIFGEGRENGQFMPDLSSGRGGAGG